MSSAAPRCGAASWLPAPLRRSLSARLTAAFVSLSLATLLLVSVASYRNAASALEARLLDRLNAHADEDATALSAWLRRQREALEFVAAMDMVREMRPSTSPAALSQLLADASRRIIAATELSLISVPGGAILASSDASRLGSFVVDQLYYSVAQDSTFTQNVYPSGTTGRPTLTVATPVSRRSGSGLTLLAAHLDLEEMEAVLFEESATVPIDLFLVNRFSEFVSAETFGRPEYQRGVHSPGIDRALAGGSGAGRYRNHDGRLVIGAWRWLPDHELALLVESEQSSAFAPARRLLALNLLVGGLAAGLLTLGIRAIARRATRPILATAAAAERVAEGDFTRAAPVESEDEVGRLATTFNAMTGQLRTLYGALSQQVETTQSALFEAQVSRALLQDVVDHATTMIVVVGLDDQIRLANRRFETALGHARGRAEGLSLEAAFAGGAGSALRGVIAEVRQRNDVVEREIELGSDADTNAWQAVGFPLRDGAGDTYAIGVIAADLTERARAEQERRHRDASVQQAQKLESLGVMAGGIAHDFNNILGAVLGNAELALRTLDDPEKLREALEQITSASRRATDLTRQMLAYAGKASLGRETVDLHVVLTELLALVRAAHSKKVAFNVAVSATPLWLEIEPAQLTQIVLNLLTNAAEAIGSAAGVVTLSTGREAPAADSEGPRRAPSPHGWVRFSIEDTGEGIPEAMQRRIFEPFFSTKRPGRGLGLSAVTGIIRATGGVLRLKSEPGVGTRFDVYLPAAPAPMARVVLASPLVAPSKRGLVLVIDDEPALRRVCRRVLEADGLTVVEAADGIAGIATFREHRDAVQVVVLDLMMPGIGGAEVLAQIRHERADLPVVIVSGYDKTDSAQTIPTDVHVHFLQKPFSIETLRRVVNGALG